MWWGGGAETWFCNRLRRPGQSGSALNDEPRVKKEREKKKGGGDTAADAELIVRAYPWDFLQPGGQESLPLPPATDFISVFN